MEGKPDLTISRLPTGVKEEFIEISNRDFCSDYGMTLKFLIENLKQETMLIDVLRQINDVHSRISRIESITFSIISNKGEEKEAVVKRSVGGKILKGKGE